MFAADHDNAAEAKLAYEENRRFQVQMRRDRLFGEWLAAKLGLSMQQTKAYVRSLVEADMYLSGQRGILAKVESDCAAHGLSLSRHRLESQLADCCRMAERQLAEVG